jgi:hypothetical protein
MILAAYVLVNSAGEYLTLRCADFTGTRSLRYAWTWVDRVEAEAFLSKLDSASDWHVSEYPFSETTR